MFETLPLTNGLFKLAAFKQVQWVALDAANLLFFRHFFRTLLAEAQSPEALRTALFALKERALREGIALFLGNDFRTYLHRQLSKPAGELPQEVHDQLDGARKRLKMALQFIKDAAMAHEKGDSSDEDSFA